VGIPGAAGATGPQRYRVTPAGVQYGWGVSGGHETLGDTIMHNPGRTTEVFRRFLKEFRFYERLKGVDANGDISRGYGQRLPYDHHELVASVFPRAMIELNTNDDYGDGAEGDALSMQAARVVYRRLIAAGLEAEAHGDAVGANDLVKFNYRDGTGHGSDPIQHEWNGAYLAWYFYGKPLAYDVATQLNRDPFYNDRLVSNGSNAYERSYGGFPAIMPWPWAAPYYPAR